jgi:ubiquinone/menaquinone biosynthesis C-methylase UbiE
LRLDNTVFGNNWFMYEAFVKLRNFLFRSKPLYHEFQSRVPKDAFVLDVGSGPGTFVKHLQKRTQNFVAFDISWNFVRKAKQRFPNNQVIQASGYTIPFKDKSFDVVTVVGVLHHVPNPPQVIDECIRVAKDKVLILDMKAHEEKWLRFLEDVYWFLFDHGVSYYTIKQWEKYTGKNWKTGFKPTILIEIDKKELLKRQAMLEKKAKSNKQGG